MANEEVLNEAREMRTFELDNDIRTLFLHLETSILVLFKDSLPYYPVDEDLIGWTLLRPIVASSRQLIEFNQKIPRLPPRRNGRIVLDPETFKAAAQSIVMALSAIRFKAEQLLLKGAACLRWKGCRELAYKKGNLREVAPSFDEKLRTEMEDVTDEYVFRQLLNADRRKNYWLGESPRLPRILEWLRENFETTTAAASTSDGVGGGMEVDGVDG